METPGEQLPNRRTALRRFGMISAGLAAGGAAGFGIERAIRERGSAPVSAASVESWRPPGNDVDVFWAIETGAKLIALTFDDGPLPKWTPMALDVLDEHKVPATFFVVGSRLERHAELVRDRFARHEVGNHTWRHQDLAKMNYHDAYQSIHRTHMAIRRHTGQEATLLRPPWGHMGGTTLHVAAEHHYDVALWSLLVRDRRLAGRPAELVANVVDNAKPGTIVLAHDVGQPSRLEAIRRLPAMIRGLRARGFEFVQLSQLRKSATGPTRRV